MYQAILFDLDDTLFSLRGCEADALRQTLENAGLLDSLPADCAQHFASISARYWSARTGDGDAQHKREQVLQGTWRDFLALYELDTSQSLVLAAQFWSAFCCSSALTPGAEKVLKSLSPHYRLGMITNGYSDSQRGRLAAAGLLEVFDPLLISEEVGAAKPDVRIFELALAQMGLPPEAALYIGDSISHDRAGCLRAGIDFCHYCPGWRATDDLSPVKFRIRRLEALIPILLPAPQ